MKASLTTPVITPLVHLPTLNEKLISFDAMGVLDESRDLSVFTWIVGLEKVTTYGDLIRDYTKFGKLSWYLAIWPFSITDLQPPLLPNELSNLFQLSGFRLVLLYFVFHRSLVQITTAEADVLHL
jgi:hypothetical protein